MANMYALPAYVPEDADPQPEQILYKLASYHQKPTDLGSTSVNGISAHNSGDLAPEVELEQKQLQLIDALKKLSSRLDSLLKSAPSPAAPAKNAAPKTEEKGQQKSNKEEKKDARKAAKAEAVGKGQQNGAAPQSGSSNAKPWIIADERKSGESGQSLTANMPPVLADFKAEALGSVELRVTKADLPWLKSIAAMAEKRGVAVSGDVSNKLTNTPNSIKATTGNEVVLKMNDTQLTCRLAIWKILGSALGLYSFETPNAIHATHQNEWFRKIDGLITGKASLDSVLRCASQFLSSFDSLSSHFSVSMADLLLHGLISSSPAAAAAAAHLPNNVELWYNRIKSL